MADFVTGDKEIDAELAAMPLTIQKKGIRKGTRAGAKIIAATAKQLAPIGDEGDLERSIKVRAAKRSRVKTGHRVVAGKLGGTEGEPFYAAFVEFGTSQRQTKSGESRGMVQEDPFLRPAMYTNALKAKGELEKSLRRWLSRRVVGATK